MAALSKNHLTILMSWLQKFISMPLQLLIMPLVVSYLGVNDYALFLLISGLMAWYSLADVSSGIVIQNKIAEHKSKGIKEENILSYSFYFYIVLFALLTCINMLVICPLATKYLLFKFNLSFKVKYTLFFLASELSLCSYLFGNISKIYYALHKGYIYNGLNIIISVLTLISIFIVIHYPLDAKLFYIILLSNLPNILFSFFLYFQLVTKVNASFKWQQFKIFGKDLLKSSMPFFTFSLNAALILQLDYVIISRMLSNNDIIQYNFANKIFMILWAIFGAILTALYSSFAEKIHAAKWHELFKSLYRNICIGIMFFILSLLLLSLFRERIELYFFHGQVYIELNVFIFFTVYYCIRVITDSFAMILSAANKAHDLFKLSLLQGAISIPLQIVLVDKIGLNGIMVGLIVSYVLTVFWLIPKKVFELKG